MIILYCNASPTAIFYNATLSYFTDSYCPSLFLHIPLYLPKFLYIPLYFSTFLSVPQSYSPSISPNKLFIPPYYSFPLQVNPYESVAEQDALEGDGQKSCVVAATLAERICSGTFIVLVLVLTFV